MRRVMAISTICIGSWMTIAAPSAADPAFDAFLECRYRDAIRVATTDTPRERLLVAAAWLEEGRIALLAAGALAHVQATGLTKMMDTEGRALNLERVPDYIESSQAFLDAPLAERLERSGGGSRSVDEIDWRTPTGWDGPGRDQSIPLHDAWLMSGYAAACFAECERMLPSSDEVAASFQSFQHVVAGRLALVTGRAADAVIEFTAMGDPDQVGAVLAEVARAVEADRAPVIAWGEVSPRAVEEAVATMSVIDVRTWDSFASDIERAHAQFEADVAGGVREAGRVDIARFRWAAGVACGFAEGCEPRLSTAHAYDGRVSPGPESNPPVRVAGIVRTNLMNLNEQTTMLSLVDGVAETLPVFTGLYDALQLYYRYGFPYRVEAPIGE